MPSWASSMAILHFARQKIVPNAFQSNWLRDSKCLFSIDRPESWTRNGLDERLWKSYKKTRRKCLRRNEKRGRPLKNYKSKKKKSWKVLTTETLWKDRLSLTALQSIMKAILSQQWFCPCLLDDSNTPQPTCTYMWVSSWLPFTAPQGLQQREHELKLADRQVVGYRWNRLDEPSRHQWQNLYVEI